VSQRIPRMRDFVPCSRHDCVIRTSNILGRAGDVPAGPKCAGVGRLGWRAYHPPYGGDLEHHAFAADRGSVRPPWYLCGSAPIVSIPSQRRRATQHRISDCISRAPESRPRPTICDPAARPRGLSFWVANGARTRDLL
jgi:hypothetical protein